jgi:uncharacterized protein YwgA
MDRVLNLLLLLYADNGRKIVGRTRIEKLTFLVQKEIVEKQNIRVSDQDYSFKPWKFGPYTTEVIDDLEMLKEWGLVSISGFDENQEFVITEKGRQIIERIIKERKMPPSLLPQIESIKKEYGRLSLDALLKKVYLKYPEYTKRSEIKEMLF